MASGYQLAWLSFAQATAECAVQTLSELFAEHGPPLVLKSDNGSQFSAEATLHLLRQWKEAWESYRATESLRRFSSANRAPGPAGGTVQSVPR